MVYKSILVGIVILMPMSLKAQKDFLVNTKGDTIRGQVIIQQNGNVEQILIKAGKRQMFPATTVREIFMRGERYKPVQFSGTIKFMKIIIEGYLSLLGFQPQTVMTYDGRLLQMRDGRLLEVPSLGFKKQMTNFLKDDADLATKIDEGKLDRRDLEQIINEYNEFISGRTITIREQAQTEIKQLSKLEMLTELRTAVEQSSLETKQDVLDMMTELEGKIKEGKPAPAYLLKLIGEKLQAAPELSTKFNEFVKQL